MIFRETMLAGAYVVDPELHQDERGFFARSFCCNEFKVHGLDPLVAQCNISFNKQRGTLRGMHYQHPDGEAKLVRCTRGSMHDVIVDIRRESATYCQSFGVVLSEFNRRMLYVPPGFAHGFLTLDDDVEVFYQMSEFYQPEQAFGARWNDPIFKIDWPGPVILISERDNNYPDFMP